MGGGGTGIIVPLGLLLGITALAALSLNYIKQSAIVAFILVGVTIGQFFDFTATADTLDGISELGIIILLFMAGLEVDIPAFVKSIKVVTIVGLGQVLISTAAFAALAIYILPLLSTSSPPSLTSLVYFGLCMTFSSTILVLGYLKKTKSVGTVYGQLALGTLVLQDIASVLGLAVLDALAVEEGSCAQTTPVDCATATSEADCNALAPANSCTYSSSYSLCKSSCAYPYVDLSTSPTDGGLSACALYSPQCTFTESASESSVSLSVLLLLSKLLVTSLIFFLLSKHVLSHVFEQFAASLELLYLGSLGFCMGTAAIAVAAGFSGEITAFLAGASIANLPYKLHVESKMEPIKSLGVAIFFISLGLKIEINQELFDSLPIGVGLAAITLLTTLPLFLVLGYFARLKAYNSFMLGVIMAQVSEFSLILCTISVRAGVFENRVLTTLTVAAVTSIIISSIGHIFVDQLYAKVSRWRITLALDERHRRGLEAPTTPRNNKKWTERGAAAEEEAAASSVELTEMKSDPRNFDDVDVSLDHIHTELVRRKSHDPDWAFEDQLEGRTMEELSEDLKLVEAEMEAARNAMSQTLEEKQRTAAASSKKQSSSRKSHHHHHHHHHKNMVATSHASDIAHGLIEGYVIVDGHLLFCTLRGGRMMFWDEQQDVGHVPPSAVWDISGMTLIATETETETQQKKLMERDRAHTMKASATREHRGLTLPGLGAGAGGLLRRALSLGPHSHFDADASSKATKDVEEGGNASGDDDDDADSVMSSSSEEEDEEDLHPWEWTIVLAHLHRTEHAVEEGEDPMKLEIHGLEDHSDHFLEDWRDAISVVLYTLNPIALRRAHILEALANLRRQSLSDTPPTLSRMTSHHARTQLHDHRNQIICLGYNEMFPAVLALGDAVQKEVVCVEYDPSKIRTVKKKYNREQRVKDAEAAKSGRKQKVKRMSATANSPTRRLSASAIKNPVRTDGPTGDEAAPTFYDNEEAAAAAAAENIEVSELLGVTCDYADIHDPESWEELEMDQAFMIVCTMKGAHHAEQAIIAWLKKHKSETIFVGVTANNVEATHLYEAGADFVMQTDALAMRSTKEIFLETIARVGDCSQLVLAGKSHRRRLERLKNEDEERYMYETG
jgi:Kef-type K+ transport system membrane component KefB